MERDGKKYENRSSGGRKYSMKDKIELVNDPNIVDGGNFAIRRNGKEYWVSRSMTISLYVFGWDERGVLHLLASKRGPKATSPNLWNVVCGYLDYGYSLHETAVKECWEECGVHIDEKWLKLVGTNSNHKYGNVNTCYFVELPDHIESHPTSIANCEEGEVTKAGWIPIDKLSEYNFMGGQISHAKSLAQKIIDQHKNSNREEYKRFIEDLNGLLNSNIISRTDYQRIIEIVGN